MDLREGSSELLENAAGLDEIFVNGQPARVPSGQTVESLLAWLRVNPERVAIELNKEIVRKRNWPQTLVQPGAHVEVVEFVGGG
jgi:sulfur carrier protein